MGTWEGTWKSGIDQAFTRQAHCLDEILELTIIKMMGSFSPRLIKSHPAQHLFRMLFVALTQIRTFFRNIRNLSCCTTIVEVSLAKSRHHKCFIFSFILYPSTQTILPYICILFGTIGVWVCKTSNIPQIFVRYINPKRNDVQISPTVKADIAFSFV